MENIKHFTIFIAILIFASPVVAEEWNFDNCGSDGRFGPSESDCDYDFDFSVQDGIQQWEVPEDGDYRIRAEGAQGGSDGAEGAVIEADVELNEGETIQILVGQQSGTAAGGGGTFVAEGNHYSNADPLIVAGGGGGVGDDGDERRGATSTCGTESGGGDVDRSCDGEGGDTWSDGNSREGGGGGGYYEEGGVTGHSDLYMPAEPFIEGGEGNTGGRSVDVGGFGGGSHGNAGGWGQSGGGAGGYSGGAGSHREDPPLEGGGGGGSFIVEGAENPATSDGDWETTGTEPDSPYTGSVDNLNTYNSGHGSVEIEQLVTPMIIENVDYTDDLDRGSFDLTVETNKNINQCTVEIDGIEYSTSSAGTTCEVDEEIEPSDEGWSLGEHVDIDIEVEDTEQCGSTCEDEFSDSHNFPNNEPVIEWGEPHEEEFEAESGESVDLRVSVSDSQAQSQHKELEIEFYNMTDGQDDITSTTVDNGQGETSVTYTDDLASIFEGRHDWGVIVNDGDESTSDNWWFEVEYIFPEINNPSPNDETIIHTETDLTVDIEQEGEIEITETWLESDDGEAYDEASDVGDSEDYSIVLQDDWDGLDEGETHEWTVYAENENELEVSEDFAFDVIAGESFRMESSLDHEYSTVLKYEEDSEFFDLELVNPDNEKDVLLSMEDSDVDAEFVDTGGQEQLVTVGTDDTESVIVQVTESEVGSHVLEIEIEDQDLGVRETREKHVDVLESEVVDTSTEVSGLGLISVLLVLLSVIVVFYRN